MCELARRIVRAQDLNFALHPGVDAARECEGAGLVKGDTESRLFGVSGLSVADA